MAVAARVDTGSCCSVSGRGVSWRSEGQGRVARGLSVVTGCSVKYSASGERDAARLSWESLVRWAKRDSALMQSHAELENTKKVTVLGGGSFGTAMASVLAWNKETLDVQLLVRSEALADDINHKHVNTNYLPQYEIPKNIHATTDAACALEDAEYIIHAVPVQHSAVFLSGVATLIPETTPIITVSKGLEVSTIETMEELIPRALNSPKQPVVCLSGPSFASEVMQQLPTTIVAASRSLTLANKMQQLFSGEHLRVNASTDVTGVEVVGALKNVLAIAAGIVEGLELGNNAMAALVAQGCAEIRWICEKMGAKSATISGPAGVGDIMLTCFVNLSRNRSVGVRLGQGDKLEDILNESNQVAEGVATAGAVVSLARKHKVQLPVLTAVARILEGQLEPREAVDELMKFPQIREA